MLLGGKQREGRTDGMRKFLRKSALLVVLLAVAVCGATRQAAAQPQVTPNGVGDLLIFGYWTTQEERDSLFAITNVFGGDTQRFVHFRIHEGVNSADVRDFTICLSPGDVWTVAITSTGEGTSGLSIGDPGSCDSAVAGAGFNAPPSPGAPGDRPLSLAADFGYISAYTMGVSPEDLASGGGDDTLMGVGTLISVANGFSSSYNATSLVGFNAISAGARLDSTTGAGTLLGVGTRGAIERALANEAGVSKEILMGRWTALNSINSMTDVVITFPTGAQPGRTDPVSIFIFDEEENFNFSPRQIILDREVNVCRFENADITGGTTELSCNGASPFDVSGTGGDFEQGWFRIINNNNRIVLDGVGDGSGNESDDINAIPDSTFPVIAFEISYFDGTAGMYDQSIPLQWIAITGQGGIGSSTACDPINGPPLNPAFVGCNGFAIPSEFAPHTLPDGVLTPADDNTTGNRAARFNTSN